MTVKLKNLLLTCLAAIGAVWLIGEPSDPSYQEQLLQVTVRQSFGAAAPQIMGEPPAVQTVLVDYVDREGLLLKARSALLRYPELARRILPIYGAEPGFQEVLLTYGEAVLLPIGYFMDHDLSSLTMRRALGEGLAAVEHAWGSPPTPAPSATVGPLTPEERGRYAIDFVQQDGFGFLRQFVLTADGTPDWVQSERVMEGVKRFLSDGVSKLETRWRQGEDITVSDGAWALADLVAVAGTLKMIKVARITRAKPPVTTGLARPTSVSGARLLARGGRLAVTAARYGAVPAALYLMIRYPSLINASLAELAQRLGLEPMPIQFMFWFIGLSLSLRLAVFLLAPLSRVLRGLGWATATLTAWFRPASQ